MTKVSIYDQYRELLASVAPLKETLRQHISDKKISPLPLSSSHYSRFNESFRKHCSEMARPENHYILCFPMPTTTIYMTRPRILSRINLDSKEKNFHFSIARRNFATNLLKDLITIIRARHDRL